MPSPFALLDRMRVSLARWRSIRAGVSCNADLCSAAMIAVRTKAASGFSTMTTSDNSVASSSSACCDS
eukprot:899895-Prymnesium_polylepis.1